MNVLKMSGLEIITAISEGELSLPTMAATMNIEFDKVEKGYVRFKGQAQERHLNPMGGVHGGFACTVLDSSTACAIHTMLEPGDSYGTIDLNVKMMRPVPVGKTIYAESRVINISKSLGVSDGRLVDGNGKLYAYASCTCKIIR